MMLPAGGVVMWHADGGGVCHVVSHVVSSPAPSMERAARPPTADDTPWSFLRQNVTTPPSSKVS